MVLRQQEVRALAYEKPALRTFHVQQSRSGVNNRSEYLPVAVSAAAPRITAVIATGEAPAVAVAVTS
ncbi:MAG: hypothetical protein BWX52_01132 [Bacteroidetes bacterium ADurb.Bin013]|nr:MAG: hypothetical protein BWX52_01132 [Bacteroidetes bacterium ADurb.Bin013]